MNESIILDQDGVLADTMGAALNIIKQERGISMCHADLQDYWFNGLPVDQNEIMDVLMRPGFYRELDVITGAVQAVNRLRERFNDNVYVVTAPMAGAEGCEAEKREWLTEHFDKDFSDRAIVIPDKTRVLGRLLIEDNPHISRNASWEPIMFDQPWNRKATDLRRMYGWNDVGVIYGT
jgi:5'(3')-deoxyribonucleotidase